MSDELGPPSLRTLYNADVDMISHEELKDLTTVVLNEVLGNDSVLGDLPNNVTLGEVDLQIAVEHGRAITVYLERFDGITVPIVVSIIPIMNTIGERVNFCSFDNQRVYLRIIRFCYKFTKLPPF